ncbi:MAG: hypothetical protein LBB86_05015 [Oscillospiraceae bacterium]|nr:hypothetical protein [Oscillospiraceae bacterium]
MNPKYSIEHLDLSVVPFSRRLARLMVLYGYVLLDGDAPDTKSFFISYTNSVTDGSSRYNLIRFTPTRAGQPVECRYQCDPGKLTIAADDGAYGSVEVVFDGYERLLFRASGGLGLRFHIAFEPHEQFMDRLDGTVYAAFPTIGAFLFEAVKGSQTNDGHWDAWRILPEETDIDWSPDGGDLLGYVQYAYELAERPESLGDVDALARENRADFDRWASTYEPVPEKYAHLRLFAAYVVWICYLAPKGQVKVPMIYFLRTGGLMRAMGWHQSYHAMALWRDLDLAVALLYSMFTQQDAHGMIPDSVSDRYVTMLAPKPPFQGFALSYILDRVGLDALTVAHAEKLYTPMCRWATYWLTFRDRDHDGLCAYVHGDESGWDDASIFSKGMPVIAPDLAAFLILLMEACGKLAKRLGRDAESAEWLSKSKTMLEKMLRTLWNGRKFICIKEDTREILDVESIAVYQPIILGMRLPEEIRNAIGRAVYDPETFFTHTGFASESQKSPLYDVTYGSFMLGMILAPVQLMMTVGLWNADQKDVAAANARNILEAALDVGPQTIFRSLPQKNPKPTGARAVLPPMKEGMRWMPGGYGSWGAGVFLILGSLLWRAEQERDAKREAESAGKEAQS